MSSSLRSRRMARNHRRMAKPPKLNLVALMDIFTILVLFLIVNNGDVEVLQADRNITLPESVSEQRPQALLTVKITPTDILVDDRAITSVQEALDGNQDTVEPLRQALLSAAAAAPIDEEPLPESGRPVVIMGDEHTPYQLLKRIMSTCAATEYRDVSLAVNNVAATPMASVQDSGALAMNGVNP